MSINFKNTIDNQFSYGWTVLGLAILDVIVVAGVFILHAHARAHGLFNKRRQST